MKADVFETSKLDENFFAGPTTGVPTSLADVTDVTDVPKSLADDTDVTASFDAKMLSL